MENTSDPLVIRPAAFTSEEAQALVRQLNAELSALYPEAGANHFQLDPEQLAPGHGAFLVAARAGVPVGCGAVRLIDRDTAELKRMFVLPDERGRGIGRALVDALEREARVLGARRLVLETGRRQQAAIVVYERAGFREIPLFGEYLQSPGTSVCLGKSLDPIP